MQQWQKMSQWQRLCSPSGKQPEQLGSRGSDEASDGIEGAVRRQLANFVDFSAPAPRMRQKNTLRSASSTA
jgi:hypothetical protein